MTAYIKPQPKNSEITIDPSKVIMSKTDNKGVIQYVNEPFLDICGYKDYELMAKPINIVYHPDMPKVIIKLINERLDKGLNIHAAVKYLTKDGRYYWLMTTYKTTYDELGNILAHYTKNRTIPKKGKETISILYNKIKKIENNDEEIAKKYFYGLLENLKMTYDEFFLSTLKMTSKELLEYFLNKSEKINVSKGSIDLGIDFKDIEQKLKPKRIDRSAPLNEVDQLKNKITKLEEELNTKQNETKKNKGLFKRFFSKDN